MKLHIAEHGSRTARRLVLLHSLALDGSVWRNVVPTVAEKFHTLTVDLRGHGQSPPDTDFTVEDMADDVAAVIREQGDASQAIVVGLSLGGCVAQAVAYGHPNLVSGLVLADTTAWYGEDAPQAWRNRADQARSNGLSSLSKFQLERWFGDEFRLANAELCADLLDRFTANDLDSYAATCGALGAYDGRGRVESISVPTEIVVGEHDGATPPADAYDLAERIEGAGVTVLPGAKHLTALERPDALCDAIFRVAKA
jgi:3-oxoadipate enol-lactonase